MLVAVAGAVLLHSEGLGLEGVAGTAGQSKGKEAGGAASSKGGKAGKVDVTALAERLEAAAQTVKTAYSECPSYDVVRGRGRSWRGSRGGRG